MKKLYFFVVLAVAACATVLANRNTLKQNPNSLLAQNVEGLSSCEVTRNNNVIFECTGNNGNCAEKMKTILGQIGITCSGQYVE